MTPEEEIADLKRRLAAMEAAAVSTIPGMLKGLTKTPQGREQIANSLEAEAEWPDDATASIARNVAAKLRE